jgi:hypothetical protein
MFTQVTQSLHFQTICQYILRMALLHTVLSVACFTARWPRSAVDWRPSFSVTDPCSVRRQPRRGGSTVRPIDYVNVLSHALGSMAIALPWFTTQWVRMRRQVNNFKRLQRGEKQWIVWIITETYSPSVGLLGCRVTTLCILPWFPSERHCFKAIYMRGNSIIYRPHFKSAMKRYRSSCTTVH